MNVLNRVTWNTLKKNRTRTIVTIIGVILSAAMMLRSSLDQPQAADAVEAAVERTLEEGLRTRDLAAEGQPFLTTAQMTERIIAELNAV